MVWIKLYALGLAVILKTYVLCYFFYMGSKTLREGVDRLSE